MEPHKIEIIRNLNRIIAPHFGVEPWDITRKDGTIPATDARRVAYHILYYYFEWRLHQIREAYHRNSVSGIHDLIRSANDLKEVNSEFAAKLHKCWDEIIQKCPDYNVILVD